MSYLRWPAYKIENYHEIEQAIMLRLHSNDIWDTMRKDLMFVGLGLAAISMDHPIIDLYLNPGNCKPAKDKTVNGV